MKNTQAQMPSTAGLPIAYGLASNVLRGHLLQAVGEASRQLRAVKRADNADAVAAAAEAHANAKQAYAACLRLNDGEARSELDAVGVTLCRR